MPTDYPQVTATVTMCRRLNLFIQTMDSLLANNLDLDLVGEWFAVDDGSATADLREIARRYPFLRLLINRRKGHPHALNSVFSKVQTRYLFHFEDDWLFETRGHYLRDSYEIMQHDSTIGEVCLRDSPGISHSTETIDYVQHQYGEGGSHWPGFTLNPSVLDMEKIKATGDFEDVPWFERRYAERFHSNGYRVAYLKPPDNKRYIQHLGEGQSAYHLNSTYR